MKIDVSEETWEKIKDQVEGEEKEIPRVEIGKYVLLRTYSAGVHLGILKRREDRNAILLDSIRIHYWDGACSLSQLAMEGTKCPDACRFAMPVHEIILTDVIEYIAVTKKALTSIKNTPTWKK